jgi:hypothetical protein
MVLHIFTPNMQVCFAFCSAWIAELLPSAGRLTHEILMKNVTPDGNMWLQLRKLQKCGEYEQAA